MSYAKVDCSQFKSRRLKVKQTTAVSQFKTFSHLGSLFGPKQSQYK